MDEPDLLIRHVAAWAGQKKRSFDESLLKEIVELRLSHDDFPLSSWPAGSAERLLLRTWPAYGSELPDTEVLRETLDTFWGFLRATGRMAVESASPAELRKEARRALPRMAEVWDDPGHHSQGRVLADFGRTIGVELEGAEDLDELQGRLDQVMEAWNALPVEERQARMPDPSPKSYRGEAMTAEINARRGMGDRDYPPWPDDDDDYDEDYDDIPGIEPGDPAEVARLARASGFVSTCLRLAEWVGSGRPATSRGLLRPAVAREAYRHLDLWSWERRYDAIRLWSYGGPKEELPPEADAILAETALNSWRSAGDCLPLDRYWYPMSEAELVDWRSSTVSRADEQPSSDEEWRNLALVLLIALCLRLGSYTVEPIAGVLLLAVVADGEPVPLDAVRAWWDSRCPEALRGFNVGWQDRLDTMLFHFEDCALWSIVDDAYTLTDLGRDFAIAYFNVVEAGILDDD